MRRVRFYCPESQEGSRYIREKCTFAAETMRSLLGELLGVKTIQPSIQEGKNEIVRY